MINNDGAIASVCKIDGKLYKQSYKNNFIIIAVILGLSIVVVGLEILRSCINSSAYDIFILISFCILFALGVFLLAINIIAVKKSDSSQKTCECEIYREYMLVTFYEKEVKASAAKLYYEKLFKCRETKDYFLAYASRTAFIPVSKESLSLQEQNTVRKLFRLRILQGAGILEIADKKPL